MLTLIIYVHNYKTLHLLIPKSQIAFRLDSKVDFYWLSSVVIKVIRGRSKLYFELSQPIPDRRVVFAHGILPLVLK
ncbi:hypothetical protein D3C78_1474410 [compost metagenome]